MPAPRNLDIDFGDLQPKQLDLINTAEWGRPTVLGYGGSRGGAKSHAARVVVLLRRFLHPGTKACILRRTYDLVRENHVEPMLKMYPALREFYHIGDAQLNLPDGSSIAFRYGETRKDILAMIGKEYMDFVVDQAEEFTEEELNICRSCTRVAGNPASRNIAMPDGSVLEPSLKPAAKLILTFNPGNIGAAYLKRIFIDRDFRTPSNADNPGGEIPEDYAFIQAYGWDNVEWVRGALLADGVTPEQYYMEWDNDQRFDYFITRSQYGRDLNAQPPALRLGWLLGDFGKFAGQYFTNWNPKRHVRSVHIESWHTVWIGIDWGFDHPASVHWVSRTSPATTAVFKEFFREGLSTGALAQTIVDMTPPDMRGRVKVIWLSHDAFAKRDERDTQAEQMRQVFAFHHMPAPLPAGKDPVSGATLVYNLLETGELVIDPSCKKLIETIPLVTRDRDRPEHTIKFRGDDAFDSLKHALKGRMPSAAMPLEMETRRQADAISNPLERWMFLTKALGCSIMNPQGTSKGAPITPSALPSWMWEATHGNQPG